MKRVLKFAAMAIGLALLLAVGGTYGATYYYTSQHGQGCASCHEMAGYVSQVHGAPHRNVGCEDCHVTGMAAKLRHISVHLFGRLPEAIRLRDVDVLAMVPACQKCHRQEFAAWHAGPHSVTYSQICADPAHNAKRALNEGCFRCHGMHFDGSVRDLVHPLNKRGPWHIKRAGFADAPAIPCLACHQVHKEGAEETRPASRISVAGQAVHDSLAFYDRRETLHFAATALATPQLHDGVRAVEMSLDPRQALCIQCHAPREPEAGSATVVQGWGPQVGSGDDRTPMGVHEGLSCVSCHNGHNENARASCKTCHPQMSNCGLDVEKMDTTYASAASAHNIHWVKCVDCHQHGIPKAKTAAPVKAKVQTTPRMDG